MILNYVGDDAENRKEIIEKILPKETIISSILEPSIESKLFGLLAKCIREELEIYRKFPKKTFSTENPKEQVKTFDPRNNGTCFMGKGFRANSEVTDKDLVNYRKAIGTINHPIWGDCTLLEIWGGDHFEEYNKMVVGAFKYGMNLTDKCPVIKVHVNPLFQNRKSKEMLLTDAQKQYKKDMEMLMAKAMVYGVKEPKKRR